MGVNVCDYGADPTGSVKSDQAFAMAIGSGSRVVEVPAGTYRLEQDLLIDRCVTLQGDGGAFRAVASMLRLIGGATVRVTQGGHQAALFDLGVQGDRYFQREALVKATAAVHIARCYVRDSGKHGVVIDGASGVGNANGWTLRDVWIENCGEVAAGQYGSDGYAVRISGRDSQGDAVGVHAVSSWGGICDRSFLGNPWVGCHVEGCPGSGYVSDTARSTWVSCYAESDSPISMGSCVIIGGTLAVQVFAKNTVPANRTAPLVFDGTSLAPHQIKNDGTGGPFVRLFLGTPDDGRSVLSMQAGEDSHEHGWMAEGANGGQRWSFQRARSALHEALAVTRVGHALGADRVIVPKGVVVGTGASQRTIDSAAWDAVLARLAALEARNA